MMFFLPDRNKKSDNHCPKTLQTDLRKHLIYFFPGFPEEFFWGGRSAPLAMLQGREERLWTTTVDGGVTARWRLFNSGHFVTSDPKSKAASCPFRYTYLRERMGTFCHSDQLYTQPIIPRKFQGLVFQAALYLQHIDMCAVTVDTSPATTASMLLFFFFGVEIAAGFWPGKFSSKLEFVLFPCIGT